MSSSAAWAVSFVREVDNAVPYDVPVLSNGTDRSQNLSQPAQQDPARQAGHDIAERQAGDAEDLASVQQQNHPGVVYLAAHGMLWEVSSHAAAITATGFRLRCATSAHVEHKVSSAVQTKYRS